MAILAFQKPDKVLMLEADSRFGKFEFRPLEPGFGITVGNALRRILLSSLEGFAINNYYLVAFFLFATVFFLPLRVRALFLVLWPRTGRPIR
jgi:hypothetical protein